MLFSSISFLYYFLPTVLILYFIVPNKFKNTVLLFSSLFFYFYGEPTYVLLMIVSAVSGYLHGLWIEKAKARGGGKLPLASSIFFSLAGLLYFKYTDFFIQNANRLLNTQIPLLKLALPIGISFYTFQILSYVIDVYRGDAKVQKNVLDFLTYVCLFPQLIAGPIVRYTTIEEELKSRKHTLEGFSEGVRRFIIGLSKKVILANTLGELGTHFSNATEKTVLFYWIMTVSFMLQVYFDFSGYSDMAIGLGRIFGFKFLENFNYPFISKSVSEFWRRWHISLGTWFRDYVYIPMGGNRVPVLRWFLNVFVVWFLTGFWHGAQWNFILWGLYFAFFLVMEKLFFLEYLEKHKYLSHFYAIILVLFGWVIFATSDFIQMKDYFLKMFSLDLGNDYLYILQNYGLTFLLAGIFSTPWIKNVFKKYQHHKFLVALGLLFLFLISMGYLVDSSFNPFLYFRF